MENGRDSNGRFASGNSFGPGRPRRPIEEEYLVTLNAAATLEEWKLLSSVPFKMPWMATRRPVIGSAKYLIGDEGQSLELAVKEQSGLTVDAAIEAEVSQMNGDSEQHYTGLPVDDLPAFIQTIRDCHLGHLLNEACAEADRREAAGRQRLRLILIRLRCDRAADDEYEDNREKMARWARECGLRPLVRRCERRGGGALNYASSGVSDCRAPEERW